MRNRRVETRGFVPAQIEDILYTIPEFIFSPVSSKSNENETGRGSINNLGKGILVTNDVFV